VRDCNSFSFFESAGRDTLHVYVLRGPRELTAKCRLVAVPAQGTTRRVLDETEPGRATSALPAGRPVAQHVEGAGIAPRETAREQSYARRNVEVILSCGAGAGSAASFAASLGDS